MRGLYGDIRFVSAAFYLILLAVIGMLAGQIATEGGVIPFGREDVTSAAAVYSPPGTREVSGDSYKTHFLGTDAIARDVASRLVHGIVIAFKVGIYSSFISLLISLLLGGLAGYVGDRAHRIDLAQLVVGTVGLVLLHHMAREYSYVEDDRGLYLFSLSRYCLLLLIAGLPLYFVCRWLGRFHLKSIWIPWDQIVIKLLEVFKSVPRLFLLLALFAVISKPSVMAVIIIIGILRWPQLTRIIRAEIINIKQEDFVKNAALLGLPTRNILAYHILPNIYKPIIVLTAINMGSAILIESSLSFLNIGLPVDQVSWGRMLGEARDNISAWWMAVGPGLLIFSMILAFNVIGDRMSYHFKVDRGAT